MKELKNSRNITQKIIDEHYISGNREQGKTVRIKIDQTLTQDATGTMCYLEFESIGVDKVKTDLSVSYVDHNTLGMGPENADDHEYLKTVAQKYGIVYSKVGNGICHQVHLERFAKPGVTILGSDSHTPTSSAIGAIAIGAGGLSVASAMAGVGFEFVYPKIIGICLTGKLNNASAKDVILTVLSHYGTTGNANCVFEYFGDGVKNLSVSDRATISNMGAECGVTTSVFPSDERTKEFLKSHKREKDWIEIKADDGSSYDEVYKIDLGKVVPMIAYPHSPGFVHKVSEAIGKKVSQVLIGSCTNSSITDLRKVAKILNGKTICPDVELGIAPGSRETYLLALKEGLIEVFIKSGARILESVCGFCIGSGMSPTSGGVSLRTNNRNFFGRSGTKDAEVYLVSPETAACSALEGKISLCNKAIDVSDKAEFPKDDSMFIFPPKNSRDIKIIKGPGIGSIPETVKLPDTLEVEVGIHLEDRITTDHISPAGSRLKFRSSIEKYSSFVFESVDEKFAERTLEKKKNGIFTAIVARDSYGQGSSREHAALCPLYLGVRAVIACSIERIHKANLCNFGILPLIFDNPLDWEKIKTGDKLVINNVYSSIDKGEFVVNLNGKEKILFHSDIGENEKEMLKMGGLLAVIKKRIKG